MCKTVYTKYSNELQVQLTFSLRCHRFGFLPMSAEDRSSGWKALMISIKSSNHHVLEVCFQRQGKRIGNQNPLRLTNGHCKGLGRQVTTLTDRLRRLCAPNLLTHPSAGQSNSRSQCYLDQLLLLEVCTWTSVALRYSFVVHLWRSMINHKKLDSSIIIH